MMIDDVALLDTANNGNDAPRRCTQQIALGAKSIVSTLRTSRKKTLARTLWPFLPSRTEGDDIKDLDCFVLACRGEASSIRAH